MKWIQTYRDLMRGRYGRFDFLNRVLVIMAFVFLLLSALPGCYFLRFVALVLVIYMGYRFFSKRIHVRLNENKACQQWLHTLDQHVFKRQKKTNISQLYFECPNCHQKLRAPKGKGKIKVTCATCGHVFIKKV